MKTLKCIRRKKPLKKGDIIPNVIFKARIRDERIAGPNPFKWKNISTEDLFKGKRCVLFALPGAFTPTCSTVHLPGYEELYHEIKKEGIDEIYCISVNDSFVMRNWAIKLGLKTENKLKDSPLNPGNFKKVKLIPDGAAKFTRGIDRKSVV
jgi:peroxiredoxin